MCILRQYLYYFMNVSLPDKFIFRCPKSWCIPETWVCDGDSNCLVGEDEAPELCNNRATEPPEVGLQFLVAKLLY